MYKLCFYVPESHLASVKAAIFKAGAGKIGNYDSCCWQTKGQGQFRPRPGSQPFLGQTDKVEIVDEYTVEVVCVEKYIKNVVKALKETHPYEEPAYQIWELISID